MKLKLSYAVKLCECFWKIDIYMLMLNLSEEFDWFHLNIVQCSLFLLLENLSKLVIYFYDLFNSIINHDIHKYIVIYNKQKKWDGYIDILWIMTPPFTSYSKNKFKIVTLQITGVILMVNKYACANKFESQETIVHQK